MIDEPTLRRQFLPLMPQTSWSFGWRVNRKDQTLWFQVEFAPTLNFNLCFLVESS
jgi:hypothetical protein